jgi:hypothetical protein
MKYEIRGRRFEGGPLVRIDTYPNERIARRYEPTVRSHGWRDIVIRPVVPLRRRSKNTIRNDRGRV